MLYQSGRVQKLSSWPH